MENYVFKIISREQIAGDFPYRVRYLLQDPALEDSIRKRGVVHPLVVTNGPKPVLIAGHKRLAAAKAAGVKSLPVLEIQDSFPEKEFFLLAVLSNWRQAGPELDLACTLRLAVDKFKMTESELLSELLPALFLVPEKGLIEELLIVSRLDHSILDLIAAEKLPFRGTKALSRFSPENQKEFASSIASKMSLTTNQLIRTVEWIYDLLKSNASTSLAALLGSGDLPSLLQKENRDPRQRAEQFCQALRRLRFPRLTSQEEKFVQFSRQFEQEGGELKLEAPESFEAEGFSLRAKIRNRESLNHVLEVLARKKTSLNSLFDIML